MNVKKGITRLASSRGTVFMEYTLLFALFAIVACMPLIPGGPAYKFLQKEMILRIIIISLPIF